MSAWAIPSRITFSTSAALMLSEEESWGKTSQPSGTTFASWYFVPSVFTCISDPLSTPVPAPRPIPTWSNRSAPMMGLAVVGWGPKISKVIPTRSIRPEIPEIPGTIGALPFTAGVITRLFGPADVPPAVKYAMNSASKTFGALSRSFSVCGPSDLRSNSCWKPCSNVAYPSSPGKNTPTPPSNTGVGFPLTVTSR